LIDVLDFDKYCQLLSPKIIITLENKDYMNMMEEKLVEIKEMCRTFRACSG